MNVHIKQATINDKPTIWHLMQLYQYDFSELAGPEEYREVNVHGLFRYDDFDEYWQESDRRAFLIYVELKLAGFAFIRRRHPAITATDELERWIMAEFFVLRRYRRRGVGKAAAAAIFSSYPGAWAVAELAENIAAHKFWRAVISRYTGDSYYEHWINQPSWHGPAQFFNSLDSTNTNAEKVDK